MKQAGQKGTLASTPVTITANYRGTTRRVKRRRRNPNLSAAGQGPHQRRLGAARSVLDGRRTHPERMRDAAWTAAGGLPWGKPNACARPWTGRAQNRDNAPPTAPQSAPPSTRVILEKKPCRGAHTPRSLLLYAVICREKPQPTPPGADPAPFPASWPRLRPLDRLPSPFDALNPSYPQPPRPRQKRPYQRGKTPRFELSPTYPHLIPTLSPKLSPLGNSPDQRPSYPHLSPELSPLPLTYPQLIPTLSPTYPHFQSSH